MKRMIDFIFHPKKNPNYEALKNEALKKSGVYDALQLALILTPLFLLAVTSSFLMSFTWDASNIKTPLADRYRLYYIVVIVCELLYEILLLYIRKNYDERYHLLPKINIFMMIMLLWSAGS